MNLPPHLQWLSALPPSTQERLLRLAEQELSTRKLELYKPYGPQLAFHEAGATYRERMLAAGNRLGKALQDDTPVLTPDGWVRIADLSPGDRVIAGDGSITRVVAVYPQGELPLFKAEFDCGEEVLCCGDHLWVVQWPNDRFDRRWSHGKIEHNPNFGRWSVASTAQIVARVGEAPRARRRVVVPASPVVRFAYRDVPLDPWLLGFLIGDGCFRGGSITFASKDAEIVERVRTMFRGAFEVRHRSGCDYSISLPGGRGHGMGGRGAGNALISSIRALGLWGKGSHEKFVPKDYLLNSPDVRLAVLQGLMDSDGSAGVTSEFSSSSHRLAEDVAFLVRSLGGKCRVSSRLTRFTYKGESKTGRRSYRVRISMPGVFWLPRKVAACVERRVTDDRILVSLRPCGSGRATCIAVDHPSRTFVTKDFIVTHNTWSAGAEAAMHLTGRYPSWWRGKAFRRGHEAGCASETGLLTRDGLQRILLGYPARELGTGMIPKDAIREIVPSPHGPKGLLEHVRIRHGGGGDVQADDCVLYLRSYDQGRERIQAMDLWWFWFDEEPPEDYYFEALTRTNTTLGPVMLTYTPLKGMSNVTKRFFMDKPPTTCLVQMGIEQAEHISPEDRAVIIATYPEHEREARVHGVPVLGSGRVFVVPESQFVIEPIPLQPHWPRICGIDFGFDHPTAIVWGAWDRDTDTVYLYDVYRSREALVPVHAAVLRAKGHWIPVAWPHDGDNDTAAGPALAKQYRDQGINMLPESAKLPIFSDRAGDNTQTNRRSVEGSVAMVQDRLIESKLKVFSTLAPWLEEYRLYHRLKGIIVKKNDDVISATRYMLMCLDQARLGPSATKRLDPARRTNWRAA